MSESVTLVDQKVIAYNGLFRVDELYTIVTKFFRSRGYFIVETRNQEDILENGKTIHVRMEPWRRYNEYAKGICRLDITVKGLKDKTVKLDGHEQKYQHGELKLVFWAFLDSDRRTQWEGSGFQFLFRTISNKFIRRDFIHHMMELTTKDCNDLQEECKQYLNMTRVKFTREANFNADF